MKQVVDWVLGHAFQRLMFWLFFLFLGILILFSLVPAQDDIPGANDIFSILGKIILGNPNMGDKIAHFVAYASVGATAFWGQVRLFGRVSATMVGLLILGGLLEFAQGSLSGRHPDFLDFIANSVGVASGLACAMVFLFCCAHLSRCEGNLS